MPTLARPPKRYRMLEISGISGDFKDFPSAFTRRGSGVRVPHRPLVHPLPATEYVHGRHDADPFAMSRVLIIGGGFAGTQRRQGIGRRQGYRGHAGRPHQSSSLPAPAVPGGDGRTQSRRHCRPDPQHSLRLSQHSRLAGRGSQSLDLERNIVVDRLRRIGLRLSGSGLRCAAQLLWPRRMGRASRRA